jgi:hypothetical protein
VVDWRERRPTIGVDDESVMRRPPGCQAEWGDFVYTAIMPLGGRPASLSVGEWPMIWLEVVLLALLTVAVVALWLRVELLQRQLTAAQAQLELLRKRGSEVMPPLRAPERVAGPAARPGSRRLLRLLRD